MRKITNKEFIDYCNIIHDNRYDYSNLQYNGIGGKIDIICPKHGLFKKIARDHKRGQGCPKCSHLNKYEKQKLTSSDEFKIKAIKKHKNKYDYSKCNYKTLKDEVIIICSKHGEFKQRPDVHINGNGCQKCYYSDYGNNQMLTTKDLIDKFKNIHGDLYDYSKVNYTGYKKDIIIICKTHGEFEQLAESHLHGGNCPKCNVITSKLEVEIRDFLTTLSINFITNDRKILNGKELDFYIPDKKVGIEFNGLYWHSEKYIDKDYHLIKTNECENKGIKLIHIFEDEWIYKQDIVKSRLLNILGLTKDKIYARKCIIKEVSSKESKQFLDENHIQGNVNSSIRLGLYYNDELISLMCFGYRPILNDSEWELIRFCNKLDTTVIGGASKLLKHFIENNKPKEIISYSDRRWSIGDLYENLGFEFVHNSKPNWFIINGGKREHRLKYQKYKLVNMGHNQNKTANQIMLENGFLKIYDSGTKKYKLSFG